MENIIKEEVEKRSIAKTLNCILGVGIKFPVNNIRVNLIQAIYEFFSHKPATEAYAR